MVQEVPAIPLLDLKRQYESLKGEIFANWVKLYDSGAFILGKEVETFETKIASFLDVKHAIGVTSGTDALFIAFKALDLKPGDKVLTTPFTFFGTISAICNAGLEPVFCDINEETFNMDPKDAERKLAADPKIRALMPIHLYGWSAEMDSLMALGKRFNIRVIEDAAQAIGTTYRGRKVGGIGDIAGFSFYPTKNLGALGDAGLITTNDDSLAKAIRLIRNHGQSSTYVHERIGSNFRIDALQACALKVFLPHLPGWIKMRQTIAKHFHEAISGMSDRYTPPILSDEHTYHQYTIRVRKGSRDGLHQYLKSQGISSGVYYPVPCHLQPALKSHGFKEGMFPVSERMAAEVLSLPVFPQLTDGEQARIVTALKNFNG